ncbi:MAG: polyprenyl synthetase family protein [Spirochaetes bacterium]|nr:MAG: polyprenyl synthetase family protein [Spirochaetota bacterium]
MNTKYTERLKKIEEQLAEVLPQTTADAWIEKLIGYQSLVASQESIRRIISPALDLIERGGKRWRPMLLVLCSEIVNPDLSIEDNPALPLVSLVEFAHNGSLIIDDIEDNADFRRGGPAVHLKYGEDVALNCGNLLYFLPTWVIDRSNFPPETKLAFYASYNLTMRRLHLGQGLDIQWHRDHEYFPSVEEYLQMCRLKTGSLSALAAKLGALAGGGGEAESELLSGICEDIGVGFQILDDVVNLTKGVPGKRRGDDIIEGKKSLCVIIHWKEAPETVGRLKELFAYTARKNHGEVIPEIEEAISLMEASGSIEKARNTAHRMLQDAANRLCNSFRPSESRDLILEMISGFLS